MVQKIILLCGGIATVLALLLPNGPSFAEVAEDRARATFAVR